MGGGRSGGGVSGRDIGIVRINRQQPPGQAVQVSDSATTIKSPAYMMKGRRKKPKTPDPNHNGASKQRTSGNNMTNLYFAT